MVENRPLNYVSIFVAGVQAILGAGLMLVALALLGLYRVDSSLFVPVWGVHISILCSALYFVGKLIFGVVWRLSKLKWLYTGLLVLLLAVLAVQASLPIVSRDALIYHLAVPKLWIKSGAIHEIPWHEWSHFPLLISVGYTGFLLTGLEWLTPFYHLSFFVLTAGVIAAFVQYKFFNEELTIVSFIIALSTPIAMRVGVEPMADLAAACYFGLGVVLGVVAIEQRVGLKLFLAAGIAFGLGLSTKYTALLGFFIVVPIFAFTLLLNRYSLRSILVILSTMVGAALLIYSPWPIRNIIAKGNPFFPFVDGWFNSGADGSTPFVGELGPLFYRQAGYGEGLLDIALIPLRMMFVGEDGNPKLFDGKLSPLFILIFASLYFIRKFKVSSTWVAVIWGTIVCYLISSLVLFHALVRYQLTIYVLLVILLAAGIASLGSLGQGRFYSTILRTALGLQLAWAAVYVVSWVGATATYSYLTSQASRTEYLRRQISEYNLAEQVNSKLPPNAVVWLLYTGNRYYYFDGDVRGAYMSAGPIIGEIKRSHDPLRLAEYLREQGITHLAVQADRTKEVLGNSLTADERDIWSKFISLYSQRIIEVGRFVVVEITSPRNY